MEEYIKTIPKRLGLLLVFTLYLLFYVPYLVWAEDSKAISKAKWFPN